MRAFKNMKPDITPDNIRYYKYDIFVSYAHDDNNTDNQILNLISRIEEDYNTHCGNESLGALKIFRDRDSIVGGEDWEEKIANGLMHSRMMIAVLSPTYFTREYCRFEFKTWCEFERERGLPNLILPIYYIGLGDDMTLENTTDVLIKEAFRRQNYDFLLNTASGQSQNIPWSSGANHAILAPDIQKKIASLRDGIRMRRIATDKAHNSPTTMSPISEYFVGRNEEIARVRKTLNSRLHGNVTMLCGLRGIGKTELAQTYAWVRAFDYPGGRFFMPCEGVPNINNAICNLAKEPRVIRQLGIKHFNGNETTDNILEIMLDALCKGNHKLLVFDNVDNVRFFLPKTLERLQTNALHILATTHIGARFPAAIKCISVGDLSEEDSIALFNQHRKCKPDDLPHVKSMARAVGYHAWSIELLGTYLKAYPRISYSDCASKISKLLTIAGTDEENPDVLHIHHKEKTLDGLLSPLFDRLADEDRFTLIAASVLPTEFVVINWLQPIVEDRFPEKLKCKDLFGRDPWQGGTVGIIPRLQRYKFFSGEESSENTDSPTRIVSLHKLVHLFICSQYAKEREELALFLYNVLLKRSNYFSHAANALTSEGRAELDALVRVMNEWLNTPWCRLACNLVLASLSDVLYNVGLGRERHQLLIETANKLEQMRNSEGDEKLLLKQCGLAHLACSKSALTRGDLALAHIHCEKSLPVWKNTLWGIGDRGSVQLKIAEAYDILGDVKKLTGNYEAALESYIASRQIRKANASEDIDKTIWMRALVHSHEKLGSLALAQDANEQALNEFKQAFALTEVLAKEAPDNAQWQHDHYHSYDNMWFVCTNLNQSNITVEYYKNGRGIIEDLCARDPGHAHLQCDLSDFYCSEGWELCTQGEPEQAKKIIQKSIDIITSFVGRDPDNRIWLGNKARAHLMMGLVMETLNIPENAWIHYQESLRIRESLGCEAPEVVYIQESLGDIHITIGNFLFNNAKLFNDEPLSHYNANLDIRRRLSVKHQSYIKGQQDLATAHELLGTAYIQPAAESPCLARDHYEASLRIRNALAAKEPKDKQKQLAHISIRDSLAGIYEKQFQIPKQVQQLQEILNIYEILVKEYAHDADADALLKQQAKTHEAVARAFLSFDEAMNAEWGADTMQPVFEHYEAGHKIIHSLAEKYENMPPWQMDLINSHANIAEFFLLKNNYEEALRHKTISLGLSQKLMQTELEEEELEQLKYDISINHEDIAAINDLMSRSSEALSHNLESLHMLKTLVISAKGTGKWLVQFARCHENVGNACMKLYEFERAYKHFKKALAVYEMLVNKGDDNDSFLLNCFTLHTTMANIDDRNQRYDATLKHNKACVAIAEILVERNLADSHRKYDLALSLFNTGIFCRWTGDTKNAITQFQRSVGIFNKLIEANPTEICFKEYLSRNRREMACIYESNEEWDRAVSEYNEDLCIYAELISSDVSRKQEWQEEFCESSCAIGRILLAHKPSQTKEALQYYQNSLILRKHLAAQNFGGSRGEEYEDALIQNYVPFLRHYDIEEPILALSYFRGALATYNRLLKISRSPEALEERRTMLLEILKYDARPLVEKWDGISIGMERFALPEDAMEALACVHLHIGGLFEEERSKEEARRHYRTAVNLLRALKGKNPCKEHCELLYDASIKLAYFYANMEPAEPMEAYKFVHQALVVARMCVGGGQHNAILVKKILNEVETVGAKLEQLNEVSGARANAINIYKEIIHIAEEICTSKHENENSCDAILFNVHWRLLGFPLKRATKAEHAQYDSWVMKAKSLLDSLRKAEPNNILWRQRVVDLEKILQNSAK